MHGFTQDGTKNDPEEADADRSGETSVNLLPVAEPRADDHVIAGLAKRLQNSRNVLRVMLSVAIHANHELISKLERQLVPGLYATSEAKVMRQAQHIRTRRRSLTGSAVSGGIVNH